LQKRVGEEQADSLRLLIVVGGHGAFVAAFRDLPQIILAHLYPQFAEPAALALAQRRIRSADVTMFCPSVHGNGL
jgi:hypothetical protein